jgi:hypothetical protein
MPDRMKNDHTSNGIECNEFDSLLADMLDGVLSGIQLDRFQAHARTCKACGPLLAEVEAGRNWLRELTEVEPPVRLVTNILASTTGVDTQRLRANTTTLQPRVSWLERVQAWVSDAMQPIWGTIRQPRFAMSFGMAFFSLSVALSVAGVKPSDLRGVSLKPSAIRRSYYSTQARVVRYYDNIRFVYEVQAAVRGFKRNIQPAERRLDQSAPDKQKERKNDTSKEPEQKQERNYSQLQDQLILASAPLGLPVNDLPVVSVTTNRRLV